MVTPFDGHSISPQTSTKEEQKKVRRGILRKYGKIELLDINNFKYICSFKKTTRFSGTLNAFERRMAKFLLRSYVALLAFILKDMFGLDDMLVFFQATLL